MIKLTKKEREYISEQIKNHLSGRRIGYCHGNLRNALIAKEIIKDWPYDGFTDYFINLLKSNGINIYKSDKMAFLLLDPILMERNDKNLEERNAWKDYMEDRITEDKYDKINEEKWRLNGNYHCIRNLIYNLAKEEGVYIPTVLHDKADKSSDRIYS